MKRRREDSGPQAKPEAQESSYDESIANRLESEIQEATKHPKVVGVRSEYAGYLDSLGIYVTLQEDTTYLEAEDLAHTIWRRVVDIRAPFEWTISFDRLGKPRWSNFGILWQEDGWVTDHPASYSAPPRTWFQGLTDD